MLIRVIISGGGTGGHIFPAISIANELKQRVEGIETYSRTKLISRHNQ